MKPVSVSELKANLSRYLRRVQRGGEVQIVSRGVPVARLVGIDRGAGSEARRRERLLQAGVLRAGRGGARETVFDRPPVALLGVDLTAALSEERGDRV